VIINDQPYGLHQYLETQPNSCLCTSGCGHGCSYELTSQLLQVLSNAWFEMEYDVETVLISMVVNRSDYLYEYSIIITNLMWSLRANMGPKKNIMHGLTDGYPHNENQYLCTNASTKSKERSRPNRRHCHLQLLYASLKKICRESQQLSTWRVKSPRRQPPPQT